MNTSFLEKFLHDSMAKGYLPGGAFIIGHGNDVVRGQVGVSDITKPDKAFTTNTICRIMSMSKALVAAGVMACVDDGTVTLNDPVEKFIPEFAKPKLLVKETDVAPGQERFEADGFTIPAGFALVASKETLRVKHLLQHTSGIVMQMLLDPAPYTPEEIACIQINMALNMPFVNETQRGATLEDFVKKLAKAPLAFEPGAQFCYSSGIDVAGRVVEVASGKPLEPFLKERIFDPCNMVDTGFSVPQSKLDRFAGMQLSFDVVAKGIMVPAPFEDVPNPLGGPAFPMSSVYIQDGKPLPWPSGSSGGVSTAEDYFNFAQMLLHEGRFNGKTVLSKCSTKVMMAPSTQEFRSIAYPHLAHFKAALGGMVSPDSCGESSSVLEAGTYGWAGFYQTFFFIDRKNNACGVVVSQAMADFPKGGHNWHQAYDGIARAYLDV